MVSLVTALLFIGYMALLGLVFWRLRSWLLRVTLVITGIAGLASLPALGRTLAVYVSALLPAGIYFGILISAFVILFHCVFSPYRRD